MLKSVAAKMGVKQGMRSFFVNAPEDAIKAMNLPMLETDINLQGTFDYIHFFATYQAQFHQHFSALKTNLNNKGMLWVSWPKSGQNGSDLTLTTVIKLGYDYGLVESKCLSINSTWSALKFTYPKEGKTYNNSYGKL